MARDAQIEAGMTVLLFVLAVGVLVLWATW